jgi:hypothetical protein
MRTKLVGLVIYVALAACGVEHPETRVLYVSTKDAELDKVDDNIRPHVAEFLQYCRMTEYAEKCAVNFSNTIDIVMKKRVSPNDPDVVGVCIVYDNNLRRVIVTSSRYDLESLEFKILVWHELGHCLMEMPHVEDRLHIMNPSMLSDDDMFENWEMLIRDFLYSEKLEKLSACSLRAEE